MSYIVLFIVAVACRAAFELARRSLVHMRKSRLLEIENKHPGWAQAIRALAENSSRLLTTAEVGAMIATVMAAGAGVPGFSMLLSHWMDAHLGLTGRWLGALCVVFVVLAVAFVIFVMGRLVPEAIAMRYPERIALWSVWPTRVSEIVFAPLVKVALWISNLLSLPLGAPARHNAALVTEQEIITMVDASEEGGLIEKEEKAMILSVLDLSDRVAREVMVPRIDVQGLDLECGIDEALDFAVQSGRSRIPLYEGSIDHIVGQLYVKDLLRIARSGERPRIANVKRSVHYTVESKRISELLKELLASKIQLSVVVDEFGGTAGIVTVEDILEEIVGEIRDEYDTHEEPEFKPLAAGNGYALDAGMSIDEVNKLLGIGLATDESDTIGGYLYDHLGEVPQTGAKIEDSATGYVFEVVTVADRRIRKINATRTEHAQTNESNGA